MNKTSLITILVVAMFTSSCGGSSKEEVKELTNFESNSIGKQTWMTKNLNVDKFRNGEIITHAQSDEEWAQAGDRKEPAWCYYNNDSTNANKYGKLYNWHAVNDPRGLAPEGWHIPSDDEWDILENFLGNSAVIKMRNNKGWNEDLNGNNESGFSGLPAGYRSSNGSFYNLGSDGHFWSSSEYGSFTAFSRHLFSDSTKWSRMYSYAVKQTGYSVRCIKD